MEGYPHIDLRSEQHESSPNEMIRKLGDSATLREIYKLYMVQTLNTRVYSPLIRRLMREIIVEKMKKFLQVMRVGSLCQCNSLDSISIHLA